MNNGLSDKESPKRRGRPKTKASQATGGHEPGPGNTAFNMTGVKPSRTLHREIITDEDRALDAQLDSILAQPVASNFGNEFHDPDEPSHIVPTKEVSSSLHLSAMMDGYKAAMNAEELRTQCDYAKEYECDSIDADENFLKSFRRRDFPQVLKDGYFIFHDIKVHVAGHYSRAKKKDARTIYDKEFVPK